MWQMENIVRVQIDGMIQSLRPEPSSWPKIFRVPPYFRKLNEEAYEPKLVSIGPYHRQNDHLRAMETLKVRFLSDLLQRRNENSAQRYVEVMTHIMERARRCYSESIVIPDDEFLKMMILDGCFIVELIHKSHEGTLQDATSNVCQISSNILRDLVLVENQLPFFVLWEIFGDILQERRWYIAAIIQTFEGLMPGLTVRQTYQQNSIEQVKHILDLLRKNWLPSEDTMREYNNVQEGIKYIRSATDLREAGIKFRRSERRNLFDIKFENETLHIPAVSLQDDTEGLFCNIIACEQFDDCGSPKYLTDYTTVMDCLIDTGKDVELLCHNGIMDRWLGTDEAAAKLCNKLGNEVILDENFFYAKLFSDIDRHYNTPWNKTKANLMHNYFNTPWASISFCAAAFLLLLTLLQTTFAIFPRP